MIAYFVYIIPEEGQRLVERCTDEAHFMRRLMEVESTFDEQIHDIRWGGSDTVPPMRILATSELTDIKEQVDAIISECAILLRQN